MSPICIFHNMHMCQFNGILGHSSVNYVNLQSASIIARYGYSSGNHDLHIPLLTLRNIVKLSCSINGLLQLHYTGWSINDPQTSCNWFVDTLLDPQTSWSSRCHSLTVSEIRFLHWWLSSMRTYIQVENRLLMSFDNWFFLFFIMFVCLFVYLFWFILFYYF